jgi:dTDP-glucose 4,6-dehydratase
LLTSEPGIYNCGADLPISIKDLVQMALDACGVEYDDCIDVADDRVGQDGCYWLDSSKLKALGWETKIKKKDGLEKMVQWVESYPELLRMSTDWKVTA